MRAFDMDRATWEARRQASREAVIQSTARAKARALSQHRQRAGTRGGLQRAAVLSPERRQEIARLGALARAMKWDKIP